MAILELEKRINSLCTHVLFAYKGHSCGIDPLALDEFDMWCGESYMKTRVTFFRRIRNSILY